MMEKGKGTFGNRLMNGIMMHMRRWRL